MFFCVLFIFSGPARAEAATQIYRSVGPNNTSDLNATNPRTVSIIGTVATFSSYMPIKMGVGDVLQYDPGSGLTLAFISGRTSSTIFTVQAVDGNAPEETGAGTSVSVFRAYTGLSNAESGTENTAINASLRDFDTWIGGKDIVNPDQQWNIACYGDAADTTPGVVIQGWTTDDDNFIKIYTPHLYSEAGTSQRHVGDWDTSKYYLVVSSDTPDGPPIKINTGSDTSSVNVWIDGLQIFTDSQISNSYGIEAYNVTGETRISNNYIRSYSGLTSNYGLYIHNLTHTGNYKVWNNIITLFNDGGINLSGSENTLYAYNNTVYGIYDSDICYKQTNGTFVAKNNITRNCETGYGGTFDGSSTNNLSNRTDAPGANPVNGVMVYFSDSPGLDYRLAAKDTDVIGFGADLSVDSNLYFSSDFEDQVRGASWDIGADEYVYRDVMHPVITAFTIPATANSLTVSITEFTATDNIAVTGYMLTESSSPPSADDFGWSENTQTTYTFFSQGFHALYAWAKDAAGGVSKSRNDSVTITLPGDTISPNEPTGLSVR